MNPRFVFSVVLSIASVATASFAADAPVPAKIEFNRDVRPIVANTCFLCHGPDKTSRKARMRLDIRDEALRPAKSGATPIVPGKPQESEFIRRVFATDEDDLMPPPRAHKPLTARQKEVLRRWIAQGAEYQQHWSYEKPVKLPVPAGQNGIDFLVQKRLADIGLEKSPQADRRLLIRRLYFDLLGLPPAPVDVEAFVKDPSPDAYDKLVDSLLQNPHFGERMAIGWLDVVRFADTIGYHSDNPRNVWPYRDWVIKSFNDNKRFDRFTLEQIAGDLLPGASQETRVGSAFNRLLLSTEEGGAQPKDYEARMLTDRVRAIGAAWLGQTTGCAQCHDHKFDPFTQRDFYSLGAFFADIEEPIVGRREEGMMLMSPEQSAHLEELDARRALAKNKLGAVLPQLDADEKKWEADVLSGSITLAELQPGSGASSSDKKAAEKLATLLRKRAKARKSGDKEAIDTYFRTKVAKVSPADYDAVSRAERELAGFLASLPRCLVSVSTSNKRTVRILPRGNWMDESGEIVKPALPHYLPQPKVEGRELSRLDLAQWLVSADNPLTARVFVNRLWKQFFGAGLSRNLDDLGAQGEWPVNGELLDWLACDFVDSGWDVKHMVRTIVTSQAYKQVSTATPEQLTRDPYNRENARQGRFRLDAELVRDNELAISGLLSPKIGGPSVKPYQPDGYWENLNFPPRQYVADIGENQYRRGIYIWWQRSFLHPSLLAFDAPSREECTAERSRSNIPQQALALLNDPTYVEASRAFAARILMECRGTVDQRIAWAWQQALQRNPAADEIQIARTVLDQNLAAYRSDKTAADALLSTGLSPIPAALDHLELAAWAHVARVLLNLHETITRE